MRKHCPECGSEDLYHDHVLDETDCGACGWCELTGREEDGEPVRVEPS